MTLNIYPKLAPMPGMTGMGGVPTVLPLGGGAAALVPFYGARGVDFGAFVESSNTRTWNWIDYSDITGGGNASDFGDITTEAAHAGQGWSNSSRLCCPGGYQYEHSNQHLYLQNIDYVASATTGNCQDFGDLTSGSNGGSDSGDDRGLRFGGNNGSGNTNIIDYATISTTGNATDFGDATQSFSNGSTLSNGYRMIRGGGHDGGYNNVTIDYVTIATTGNASDFGDLTLGRACNAGASSDLDSGSDRGVCYHAIAAGSHNNTLDYVTISTTGNATDFGDGTAAYTDLGGTHDNSRGLILGGGTGAYTTAYDYIRYITIDTTGNASALASLTGGRRNPGGASGAAS